MVRRDRLLAFVVAVAGLEAAVFMAQLGRDTTPFALVLIPAVAAIPVAGLAGGLGGIRRSTFHRMGSAL